VVFQAVRPMPSISSVELSNGVRNPGRISTCRINRRLDAELI
jgi:hypothetical protein